MHTSFEKALGSGAAPRPAPRRPPAGSSTHLSLATPSINQVLEKSGSLWRCFSSSGWTRWTGGSSRAGRSCSLWTKGRNEARRAPHWAHWTPSIEKARISCGTLLNISPSCVQRFVPGGFGKIFLRAQWHMVLVSQVLPPLPLYVLPTIKLS